MRRPVIDEPNRYLVAQQRNFRAAADFIATAFSPFSEIEAIALIGSVAKTLWKEVPRFREFRRARDLALRSAYEASPLQMTGKTRYNAVVRHWSAEDKARHEQMGFHAGWGKATDQLEALARTL